MNTYRYVKGYTGALDKYTNKMQNVKNYIDKLKDMSDKTDKPEEKAAINREYRKQKKLFEKLERKRNKMLENKDTTLTKDIGRFWDNIKQSTKDGGMSVGRMFKNQGLKLFGMRSKMASNFDNAANRMQKQIDSINEKLKDPELSDKEKLRLKKKRSKLNAKREKYLEQAKNNRIISQELRNKKYNIFGYLSRSNERSELISSRSLLDKNITDDNGKVQSLLDNCPYISERLRKIGIPTDIDNMGPSQKRKLVELYNKISNGKITKQNVVQQHKALFNNIIEAKFNNNKLLPRTTKPVNTSSFNVARVNSKALQNRIDKWKSENKGTASANICTASNISSKPVTKPNEPQHLEARNPFFPANMKAANILPHNNFYQPVEPITKPEGNYFDPRPIRNAGPNTKPEGNYFDPRDIRNVPSNYLEIGPASEKTQPSNEKAGYIEVSATDNSGYIELQ
jgi:hypothetical protein